MTSTADFYGFGGYFMGEYMGVYGYNPTAASGSIF